MTSYYTRLQRKQEKSTRRQTYILLSGSVILFIVFIVFGIPFLFSLSSQIIGLRKPSNSNQNSDSLAPNAPNFDEPYEATSSAQIILTGRADPEIKLETFQNGISIGKTKANDEGKFAVEVTLNNGINNFYAIAINSEGKKSDRSESYGISFSNTPPKLELSVKDGDQFKDNPITITGTTDPGCVVTINDHRVIVAAGGGFSYILVLSSGDNKIKIVTSDQADNKTEKEITLKLQS